MAGTVQLTELARLVGGTVSGAPAEVRGVQHDSRAVRPGDLFVCLVGGRFDGHRFIGQAVERGAAAIAAQADHPHAAPPGTPTLVVPDTRAALPVLAAAAYGHPSRRLRLIGVTGTNGKTSTTLLIAAILRAWGLSTGTIGTLGAELMGEELPSERTTPEADQLQALLAAMLERGAQAVAMEVSSHALVQRRTDGCAWDAAAFTNLTQDHLDFHPTLEDYFQAKLRLFRDYPAASDKPFVASVNADDPRGHLVVAATRGRALTYGVHAPADVQAVDVQVDASHVAFRALTPAGEVPAAMPFGGAFQVSNALAAIGVAVGLGVPVDAIAKGLAEARPVPGRFEAVPTDRGFHVVVDYAHTPDGLENLLNAARRLEPKRLIVVFGCGGDRDRGKRPIMGRLAAMLADVAVVTSDNPRTEQPQDIIDEIVPGTRGGGARVVVEPDRRAAISLAIHQAEPGDIVLLAGKGHEDYQEIDGVKHPFDDRLVAREILSQGT